jgi:CBS domain containing-hemolysin-like protein
MVARLDITLSVMRLGTTLAQITTGAQGTNALPQATTTDIATLKLNSAQSLPLTVLLTNALVIHYQWMLLAPEFKGSPTRLHCTMVSQLEM